MPWTKRFGIAQEFSIPVAERPLRFRHHQRAPKLLTLW